MDEDLMVRGDGVTKPSAGDSWFLIEQWFEMESFSQLSSQKVIRLERLMNSPATQPKLRLLLLETFYYESLLQLDEVHLELYLDALAALSRPGQYLYGRRIFFPRIVEELRLSSSSLIEKIRGRLSGEIVEVLFASVVAAGLWSSTELGEIGLGVAKRVAIWTRAAVLWHALILAKPIVPIWSELPPYSYSSLAEALMDWSYADDGSADHLVGREAISLAESQILLEFGRLLRELMLGESLEKLAEVWFTAPHCAQARNILQRVFSEKDTLDCIYSLPPKRDVDSPAARG